MPTIQKRVELRPYNTLKVPATACRLVTITHPDQLTRLYRAGELTRPVLVLGGGSNILFRSSTDRLVIKNEIRSLEQKETERHVLLTVGAGVIWHDLVTTAVERGWGGLENLALIPGTVGAAPIQNIGAYGVELSDRLFSLNAFDLERGTFRVFTREECHFGYRDSLFKQESVRGRYIITSVTLKLWKAPHPLQTSYKTLSDWLGREGIENPSIEDIFRGVIAVRSSRLPDPAVTGNAGSFFKNPVVPESTFLSLQGRYPGIPGYPAGSGQVKLPAGWLIDQAGWRGERIGEVGTYEHQALVIVNHGSATGQEIWDFAKAVRASVHERFGIELVPEVNVIEPEVEHD